MGEFSLKILTEERRNLSETTKTIGLEAENYASGTSKLSFRPVIQYLSQPKIDCLAVSL